MLPEPPTKRGGFVARVHEDTWIVSLHTRFEKELPKSYQEMLAFAESIEVPDVADFLRRATLEGEIRSFRKAEAVWRRFDKGVALSRGSAGTRRCDRQFQPDLRSGHVRRHAPGLRPRRCPGPAVYLRRRA